MNTLEAMENRHSRRSYTNTPIDSSKLAVLKTLIEKYNEESGLSIQFIDDGSSAFDGLSKSYGMFKGVRSFFAMIGNTENLNMQEKAGYYGELLVLEATKLGLGTCWVSGSFDRKHCPCSLKDKESLVCVITVGNVEDKQTFREKAINKLTHHRTKPLEYFYTSEGTVPNWFLNGIKAVHIAPSAANSQPVHFTFKNGIVAASIKSSAHDVDLGIAKAHFELASGLHFDWGNHGKAASEN